MNIFENDIDKALELEATLREIDELAEDGEEIIEMDMEDLMKLLKEDKQNASST